MKTKNQKVKGLRSRSEQLSAKKTEIESLLKIDFERRRENRRMTTDQLLEVLRTQSPRFWEQAEVVGQWVWVQFTDKQPRETTAELSQLGFHWNNERRAWQHPCGTIIDEGAKFDPRKKYGSYFPADSKSAA